MNYSHTIQCVDKTSGATGCFIHAGDFVALSPVFGGLIQLYDWMRIHGWKCNDLSVSDLSVRKVQL